MPFNLKKYSLLGNEKPKGDSLGSDEIMFYQCIILLAKMAKIDRLGDYFIEKDKKSRFCFSTFSAFFN
jgi:hypothetical protein